MMWLSLLVAAAATTTVSGFVPHASTTAVKALGPKTRLYSTVELPPTESLDNVVLSKGEVAEQSEQEGEKFDWFKAWYPLVPVETLDPEIPHRFQLLGMDLVVWNDGAVEGVEFGSKKKQKKAKRALGEWRVFVDECPHRKVPLSEGRVENDGTLLCSYHAFRFDGQGQCVDLPQMTDHEGFDLARVQQNPKSRCNSFPVQIIDGLLWVWPATGDDARLESALTPAQHYKLGDDVDPNRIWHGTWNYRELPYSVDYFIENVVDPAHVQVSHHGIIGSRYNDQYLKIQGKEPLTKNGFSMVNQNRAGGSTTTFQAPAHVNIESQFGDGAMQTLELYASPSRPGFCHHVGRMVVVKDRTGEMPKAFKAFTLPLPKWLNHVMAAGFLNQDAVFLHHQERHLAKTKSYVSHAESDTNDSYMDATFPVKADYGVMKYRTWLSKLAGGHVPYQNSDGTMPEASPDVCFDQWHSHTSKCQYCLGALRNLKRARLASFVASAAMAVLRPAPKQVLNLAGVLATAGLGFGLNKLIGMFYRQEFSHSHND